MRRYIGSNYLIDISTDAIEKQKLSVDALFRFEETTKATFIIQQRNSTLTHARAHQITVARPLRVWVYECVCVTFVVFSVRFFLSN